MLSFDTGILVLRLIVGLGIAAHGAQKLFGWFGGYGIKGTGGFFESLGFRPGSLFAVAAGIGEFGGGVLIALGLLGPAGATLVTATMLTAIFTVHAPKGFFNQDGGWELPAMYSSAAFALAFAGPGLYSLDALAGLNAWENPTYVWIGFGVAILGLSGNLVVRRPVHATPASTNGGGS